MPSDFPTTSTNSSKPSSVPRRSGFRGLTASSAFQFLLAVGIVSCGLCLYLSIVSFDFEYVSNSDPKIWEKLQQRPILRVLFVYLVLFSLYLASIGLIGYLRKIEKRSLWWILLFGVLFRLVSVCSVPIQEIDIYRYVWDGKVTAAGYNPYHFSPEQVRGNQFANQPDLLELRELAAEHDGLNDVVHRIHMEDTCTIYPPVSQAVFALAVWVTPANASAFQWMFAMKIWIVIFDIFTMFLVVILLKQCGRSPLWVVAYAWCPLVVKEFANGGHLDSVAICLSTLTVVLAVQALKSKRGFALRRRWFAAAGVALALAIGAKIYPAVLLPIFAVVVYRAIDWRWATVIGLLVIGLSGGILMPQLMSAPRPSLQSFEERSGVNEAGSQEARSGLEHFTTAFEMNDFLFMLVYEHVHPRREIPESRRPWFVVNSAETREALVRPLANGLEIENGQAAFLLARLVTLLVLMLIIIYLCRQIDINEPGSVVRALFLTLAWFWLLSPTQNPWYWCWALPFIAFARNRTWYLLSGFAFIYYVRFYFNYHFHDSVVWPSAANFPSEEVSPIHLYNGDDFFYLIVVFIEFAPWFVLLIAETAWRRIIGGK